jgi:RimJ/RimL family protein N-acetyltransferase
MDNPLFEMKTIYLTAANPLEDSELESEWTHQLDYARWFDNTLRRPLSRNEIKKFYEQLLKKSESTAQIFHFAVHLVQNQALVGFVRINDIQWTHRAGHLEMGFGVPGMPDEAFEETLQAGLHYAFHELNLHHLAALVPGYDEKMIELFDRAKFTLEVRQVNNCFRNGKKHDLLHYGMLRQEWEESLTERQA